jgi:Acetyl-CoA hydrolase
MATRISTRARIDARFVNNAMMATLMGAAISDGLENGQVVSGVGGQYNFVAQAFALAGARSVLTVEATRQVGASRNPIFGGAMGTRPSRGTCAMSSSPNTASPTSGGNPTPT